PGTDPPGGGSAEPGEDAAAYPFEVGYVPAGYRLSAIGAGTDEPEWDPEMGSDQPYTVIDVDGITAIARVAPWEPMESEFQWASGSGDHSPELFALEDGRNAAFGDAQDAMTTTEVTTWNDLVVEVDRGTALVVAGDLPKETLVEVAEGIDPAIERTAAPVVADAPDSWTVLGSVQPDGVVALATEVRPRTPAVPGPAGAYAVGYDRPLLPGSDGGLTDTLAVMTLPGASIDLDALTVQRPHGGELVGAVTVDVDGRPGHVTDSYARFGGRVRSLAKRGEDGALIVVTASTASRLDADELARVAASVRRLDGDAWDQAIVDVFGGPGLQPDAGEAAIATGSFGDVGWLLQTRTYEVAEGIVGATAGTFVNVDECLKLSTRQRLCNASGFGGSGGGISVWNRSSPEFDELGVPPFVTITSNDPAAVTARLTLGDEVHDVGLHPVPGGAQGNLTAGIAAIDVPPGIIPTCHPDPSELPEPPAGITAGRIDLLDEQGAVIGCIGM
ncbi:MAG: hypothetical protein M3Y51_01145, partial [Actinomycetota bacterium]|nr:hypothetical protein [Actinomycetota bacterium]